ncbi:MAG: APC family permease [Pseudomonadota bacterium]
MSDYLAKKELHALPLALIAISTILGSGWLLAPGFVFSQAGTYGIYSWIIAFLMILLIALCFAETCSMIPRDGSTTVLPRITHGYLVSSIFGVLSWLSWLALVPIEAQATIQYLSHFYPNLIYANSHLTGNGKIVIILLIISISIINYFSIKWVSWLNKYLFITIKIGVPLCVIIYGAYASLHIPRHEIIHSHSVRGIFSAIPLGIIFAFNGFKSVCTNAGRAKNPAYAIPFALFISLLVCLLLYVLLQFTYNINATASLIASNIRPFADMIYNTKTPLVDVLIFILYVGAVTSPYAANIFNLSSSNTAVYRSAKFGYIPSLFKHKNRFKTYHLALFFNTIISLIIALFLGQGWGKMVNNLTSIMMVNYTVGPLCLLSLRYQHPDFIRTFKLPFGLVFSVLAFIVANFMIYWCGWDAIRYFLGAAIIGAAFTIIYHGFVQKKHMPLDFRYSIWMWVWFIGIGVISYYGSYGDGRGVLSGISALIVIGVFSIIIILWSLISKLPIDQSNYELKSLDEPLPASVK